MKSESNAHLWWDSLTRVQKGAEITNMFRSADTPIDDWTVRWDRLQYSQQIKLGQYYDESIPGRRPLFK
jgi:hypothetical protein